MWNQQNASAPPSAAVRQTLYPHELNYFSIFALLNRAEIESALAAIVPGQRHLVLAISYDDQIPYGPRGVGVAFLVVLGNVVRVRYMIREGDEDRAEEYMLSLDEATEVLRVHVGTRAALNFRKLGS